MVSGEVSGVQSVAWAAQCVLTPNIFLGALTVELSGAAMIVQNGCQPKRLRKKTGQLSLGVAASAAAKG